jgi:hypothetical protein
MASVVSGIDNAPGTGVETLVAFPGVIICGPAAVVVFWFTSTITSRAEAAMRAASLRRICMKNLACMDRG